MSRTSTLFLLVFLFSFMHVSTDSVPAQEGVDPQAAEAIQGDPEVTAEEAKPGIVANTIVRQRDPLLVEGQDLKGLFEGQQVSSVTLYAYKNGEFVPIPHQFDFIDENGLVIPGYVNRVIKKGAYDFVPNSELPTVLGKRYQLLFMARDTGDRFAGAALPTGFRRGAEIEVEDPRGGQKGWAYLMLPVTPPPPCLSDYVDYTLIRKGGQNIEQIQGTQYTTGFPDPDKPFAYGYWKIPLEAGGTDINLLQTFRVRIKVKILFMTLELDPKKNVVPYVLGYNDGPIRVTRRVFSSVVLGGIKMDSLMGDAKLETESHYFESYFFFDGEVSLPGFVKKISKIKAEFTTDFAPTTTGFQWYNSRNAGNRGCVVDGLMSPQEQALDQSPYEWSLLFGHNGGWANILQMHTDAVRPNMNLFYLDDASFHDEDEPTLQGTWASTGYYLEKLDKVKDTVSFRTNIFSIPNTFQVEQAQKLVDLVYHPLKPSVQRTWDVAEPAQKAEEMEPAEAPPGGETQQEE